MAKIRLAANPERNEGVALEPDGRHDRVRHHGTMTVPFLILALLTVASAIGTMAFRQMVHCALSMAVTLVGLAGLFLQLHAEFAGFAQILVYVGAVSVVIMFAILLTKNSEPGGPSRFSSSWIAGAGIALAMFLLLSKAISASETASRTTPPAPDVSLRQLGESLMGRYSLPLEVMGLLLTAALLGAVIVALPKRK